MNLIEKALRYIYILTSKAGWAYDRQSREVWERRRAQASDRERESLDRRYRLYVRRSLHNAGFWRKLFGRCWVYYGGGTIVQYRPLGKQRNQNSRKRLIECVESGRCLTSKEVAA